MADLSTRRLILPGGFAGGIVKDAQGRCWKLRRTTNTNDEPLSSTEGLKSEEGFACCEACGPITRLDQVVFDVRGEVELPEFTESESGE